MRIKTLFLSLAVTLLASMSTLSASAADYVKVSDKDGKDTYFALSEKPTVTFTSTAMILTAGSQTVEYPLTDFRAFAFADQPTGIGTLDAESNNAVFSFGNSLKGEGLKAGSQVAVYTINGQLVGRATVSQSGSVEIPLAVQAQSLKVTKTDGSVVTYNASDISKIEFLPSETPSQPKLIHEFAGYLTVKNRVLDNVRFDTGAKIKVLQDGAKFLAEFSDTQWGTGSFVITMNKHAINGTGKMKIANPRAGGAVEEYDATMSGSMTEIKISIPSLMGGTDITWHYAEASAASKVAGNYIGTTALKVGDSFGPFTSATVGYKITANEDGTINVTASEENYTGVTMMGNLTLGTYTVKNLAYDKESNSFVRDYSNDGLKVHFKAVGGMPIDNEYSFKATSKMVVTVDESGTLTIKNNYSLARMPFPISATYTGKKAK